MKHLTKIQLEKAIKESLGNKGHMLQLLGIKRYETLNSYLNRWGLQGMVDEQKMIINDQCRNNIHRGILEGDQKYTMWYAERRMYDEYGNKQTVINENHNYSDMTDDELDSEIKKYDK